MTAPQRLQTVRASAALTATLVATDAINVDKVTDLILYFTYTRGAENGAFQCIPETSPFTAGDDDGGWFPGSIEQVAAVTAGADGSSVVQRDGGFTYKATGAPAESFAYHLRINKSSRQFRLRVRESSGVTAGTLAIYAAMEVN